MRKLKVVLVLLCAMLVSVGLFACKKKKPNEPVDPTPPPDDNSITAITGVEDIPTLTDSDDASVYQEKIKDITVTYRVGRTTGSVKGSACDITGEISYHKVGTYTLKAKPRDNNSGGKTIEFKIKVVHDFDEADEHGVSTCDYCKARRVASEEELTLHYGDFHYGTTAKLPKDVYEETEVVTYGEGKEATSNIKQFGSVNGATSALEVPTLTAGDLEKGTTITVRGTAKTAWEDWGLQENKFWFFPVIGFADPYMNNASFDGKTHSSYVGGTSVFVRGEGWVLYNGVGDPRTLASLSGGQSERINYGSWEGASAGSDNPIPDGFVNGEMPDPASDAWHDWWVYSFGTQINSGDFYQDETPIELVWTYREDGIIELQYNYNYVSATNAVSLVAYVKVPDSTRGYYRTMLHGDYVDMTITGYEKIETLTPTDFQFNAEATGTVVLHEGAMLDASALKTQFKYVQTGDAWQPYTVVADNVYATTDETVDEETEWVSLGENALRTAYKNYKIELIKAGQTFTASIPAANIKVVSNAIAEAFGSDATIGGVSFVNNRKVGAFALGTDAEGTAITLALQGAANYAQALNAAQKTALNITEGEYRYVVLRLTNNGLKAFDKTGVTVKSGTTDVPYLVDVQDGDAYLVLALTEETARGGVVIGGLNGTPVNVSFGTLNGFKITSTVSSATSGKLNEGGSVTFTFTAVAGSTIGEIKVGSTTMGVDILTGAISNTTTYPNGILVDSNKFITAIAREGQSVTLTVKFPAANISDYSSCEIGALLEGAAGADIMEEVHYEFAFADNVQGDKGAVLNSHSYAYEKDGKLIVVAALAGMDDVTELDTPIASNVNVNAGDLENIRLLDLSYVYSREEQTLVFTDAANLPAGVSLRYQEVSGVGILLFFEFDKAKLGFEGDYAFEPNYTEGENVYYTVKDGAVTAVTVTEAQKGEKQIIVDGDCIDAGIVANIIKDKEDNVIFYFNPASVGGEHRDSDNNGVCDLCGAEITHGAAGKTNWWSGGSYVYDGAGHNIADGDFYEFIGQYESFAAGSSGMTVFVEHTSGDWGIYRVNATGWAGYNYDWTVGAETVYFNPGEGGEDPDGLANGRQNFTSDLTTADHPYSTLNGWKDSDGNEIATESLKDWLEGATFRYTVTRVDGVMELRTRFYKGDDITVKALIDFSVYVAAENNHTYKVGFDFWDDKCKVKGGSEAIQVYRGKIANSVLTDAKAGATVNDTPYAGTGLTFGKVSVNNGVSGIALGGMASELTGVAGYTHYVAFTLNFSQALVESTKAAINLDGAIVELNEARTELHVWIPVNKASTPDAATITLENFEASTMQGNIEVDLSQVVASDVEATPNTNALYLNKGSFTIDYTGLDDAMTVSVNGGTAVAVSALSASQDLGVVTAVKNGNSITFTLKEVDFTAKLSEYVVVVKSGENVVASTTVSSTKLDAEDAIDGDVLAIANGTKLTFVFPNIAEGTQTFKLNANNGAAMSADNKMKLDLYDLSFNLAPEGKVTFTDSNLLRTASAIVYSRIGDENVVALTVDLKDFGIAADTAYGFEAVIGSKDTQYRAVSAERELSELALPDSATPVTVVEGTCAVDAIVANSVLRDDAVVFYYGITKTKAGHKFPADGGLCTVCEEVTGWKVENVQVGTTDNATAATLEHGNGKAYNPAAESRFSTIVAGQKVVAQGKMTAKAGANDNGADVLLYKGSTAVDGDHIRNDDWINNGTNGAGNVGDRGLFVTKNSAKLNGGNVNWEKYQQIKVNADITITWDWTDKSKVVVTIDVNGITTEGNYVQIWTITAQEGTELGNKLSIGIEPRNGSFIGTITATADASVVAAADCNPIKHTHVYSDTTDRCECGALKPGHEHAYDETTQLCKCGALNPAHMHSYEKGLCTLCGNVQPSLGATGYTAVNQTVETPTAWNTNYELPEKVAKGKQMVILGTQQQNFANHENAAWFSLVVEFLEGYTLRSDNYGWTFGDAGNFGDRTGNARNSYADGKTEGELWADMRTIATACNWRVLVNWTGDNLVIVLNMTATSGTLEGCTYTCSYSIVVSNTALTEVSPKIGGDHVDRITIDSYQLIG